MPPARTLRNWTAILFVIGLGVRLVAVFALHRWDDPTPGVQRQLALSLLDHKAFYFRDFGYAGPSSLAAPVYPTLLAGLFTLFGRETPTAYFAALVLNAAFGGLCAGAAFRTASRAGLRDGWAIAAGLLVAVWPPQVVAALYVQPMALTGLIGMMACLFWLRAVDKPGVETWLAFSVMAALAGLMEPMLLPAVLAALGLTPFVSGWAGDVRVRNAAVLAAAIALLIVPWVGRNRAAQGLWTTSTVPAFDAWSGANPNATGSDRLRLTPERRAAGRGLASNDDEAMGDAVRPPTMQSDLLDPRQREALRDRPEADRARAMLGWATAWARENSGAWAALVPVKLAKSWFIDWDHPMSRHPVAAACRWLLGLAALAGLVLALRARLRVGWAVVVLASAGLTAALTIATAKRTVVLEPMQIVLACAGASALRPASRAIEGELE